MSIPVNLVSLAAFAAALVRASAFLSVAPPFAGGLFSPRVRGMVALAFALATYSVVPTSVADLGTFAFLIMILGQLVIGLALGFAVLITFSAARSAGEIIDNLTGSTLSVVFDPLSGQHSPVIGRFYQLAFTACLFAINGHLLLVAGFRRTFVALPLVGSVHPGKLAQAAGALTGQLALSALEIAGPILVALFLIEMSLGLLARAAPQLNVLVLGLGVKALVSILLLIMFVPAIPALTSRLLDHIGAAMALVARAFT